LNSVLALHVIDHNDETFSPAQTEFLKERAKGHYSKKIEEIRAWYIILTIHQIYRIRKDDLARPYCSSETALRNQDHRARYRYTEIILAIGLFRFISSHLLP
jgi:hypothetical protein